MFAVRCVLLSLAFFAGLLAQVDATLVALPNGGWTAGAPAPGQTDSQTFTTFGPNMTIAVTNGTAASGVTWSGGYPAINASETTGGFSGSNANGFQLYALSSASAASYVLTTISFAAPVYNLSFQIWDVDKSAGQFVDTITAIKAMNGVTSVAATSVTSAMPGYNTVTGSGLGTTINGTAGASNTTNQGTIDITFSGPIDQFSFKWSNTDAALGGQAIGIGDINFSTVPEADTLWPVMISLGCAISARFITRARGPAR
jgi:hypothetical protein